MTAPVLFEERAAANGMRFGIATLNSPQTLNGLSLEMVELLAARLDAWARDPGVALVVLQGAGEKAFCAGGDLHGLYRSMTENAGKALGQRLCAAFLRAGIPAGLPHPHLSQARAVLGSWHRHGRWHRAHDGRQPPRGERGLAPGHAEVSIGLFPDVGGSWLLNRMPGRIGMFLALTGAQLNTADAFFAGLADFRLDHADWPKLLESLQDQPWAGQAQAAPDSDAIPAFHQ